MNAFLWMIRPAWAMGLTVPLSIRESGNLISGNLLKIIVPYIPSIIVQAPDKREKQTDKRQNTHLEYICAPTSRIDRLSCLPCMAFSVRVCSVSSSSIEQRTIVQSMEPANPSAEGAPEQQRPAMGHNPAEVAVVAADVEVDVEVHVDADGAGPVIADMAGALRWDFDVEGGLLGPALTRQNVGSQIHAKID